MKKKRRTKRKYKSKKRRTKRNISEKTQSTINQPNLTVENKKRTQKTKPSKKK